MSNVLDEYLVKIGFDVKNNGEASKALETVQGLGDSMNKLGSILKAGGIAALLAKITDSIIENIKSVAKADLEYEKLAKQMWVTKETAKSLSVILKTMGASEKDVAWVPELREQFFRLRNEMAELSTPVDADAQLKWIRQIGYDIESLQLKFKKLKEWFVYYLIKYMQPIIKSFQDFIGYINKQFGSRLPQIAKKLASWAASFMSVMYSGFRAVKNIFSWLWGAFQSLPSKVKALVPAFAAAGALIMMSPFGLMLTAIGGALILLEDFFYYLDGKKSSKTLAPMWAALLKFANGSGSDFLNGIKNAMGEIYEGLKNIFEGIDYTTTIEYLKDGLREVLNGFENIIKAHADMLNAFSLSDPKIKEFFRSFGNSVGMSIRQMGRLAGLFGKIMQAIALALKGSFMEAAKVAGSAVVQYAKGAFDDFTGGGEKADTGQTSPVLGGISSALPSFSGVSSAVEKAKSIVANPTADFLGNPNGCTYFVKGALGEDNEFMKALKGNLWVPDWVTMAEKMKRFVKGTAGMKAGDIIVYDYKKPGGFGDHVVLSDGKGGAYGNSTEDKAPKYYKDMHKLGNIAGYIRTGSSSPLNLNPNSYGLNLMSSRAQMGNGPLTKMYYSAGTNIGNININISTPNPLLAGDSVVKTLQGQIDAHNVRGLVK